MVEQQKRQNQFSSSADRRQNHLQIKDVSCGAKTHVPSGNQHKLRLNRRKSEPSPHHSVDETRALQLPV